MPICEAITKKGKGPKCTNGDAWFDAETNQYLCHLHHPQSLYRQQVSAKRAERGGRRAAGFKDMDVRSTPRPKNLLSVKGAYYVQGMADRDLEGVDPTTPTLDRPMPPLDPSVGRDPKAFLSRHPRIEE